MAELKVFQFFLLVSFVIFSTHALEVFITEGIGKKGFEHQTKINVSYDRGNGLRYYNHCAKNKTFVARPDTTKVVVYIRSEAQWKRDTFGRDTFWDNSLRELLCRSFRKNYHYELLYLIIYDFITGDERVISDFLYQSIKPDPGQNNFQIDVIGEGDMNLNYTTLLGDLDKYQEDVKVFGGKLYERIRDLYPR